MAVGRERAQPVELCPTPWPSAPSADPYAEVARRFVVALNGALNGRSVRSIAADAGLTHGALNKLLAGRSWPNLLTIARLERALGADLWPGRPEV